MVSLNFVLILIAIGLFIAAGFSVRSGRFNLVAFGLAALTITLLTGCDNDRVVDRNYTVPEENEVVIVEDNPDDECPRADRKPCK